MDIVTAVSAINTRLGALSVTSPVPKAIARVFDPTPPDSETISDFPCWLTQLTFVDADRTSSQFIEHYNLRLVLLVKDADRDVARKIVRAFHVAFIAAFAPHPTLAGKVTDWQMRGGAVSEGDVERDGIRYAALDLLMDLTLKNAITYDTN